MSWRYQSTRGFVGVEPQCRRRRYRSETAHLSLCRFPYPAFARRIFVCDLLQSDPSRIFRFLSGDGLQQSASCSKHAVMMAEEETHHGFHSRDFGRERRISGHLVRHSERCGSDRKVSLSPDYTRQNPSCIEHAEEAVDNSG